MLQTAPCKGPCGKELIPSANSHMSLEGGPPASVKSLGTAASADSPITTLGEIQEPKLPNGAILRNGAI